MWWLVDGLPQLHGGQWIREGLSHSILFVLHTRSSSFDVQHIRLSCGWVSMANVPGSFYGVVSKRAGEEAPQ